MGLWPHEWRKHQHDYRFAQPLVRGSFVSITIAFDRTVVFDHDGGTIGQFDFGDTFVPSASFVPGQDQFNDLDLYLMPVGATSLDDRIALSQSSGSTIDHLFAQIPATGQYEFWINQFNDNVFDGQNYAIAWWADAAPTHASLGTMTAMELCKRMTTPYGRMPLARRMPRWMATPMAS
jgi:hypothetical protein